MSSIKGVAAIRRQIRAMPEAVQKEINTALEKGGRELAGAMKSRAPRRSGRLMTALGYKLFPKTMRLQVGILGTKRQRRDLFYARILDLGRKAQTVQARRHRADGTVTTYALNVKPIRAMRFVTGPLSNSRERLNRQLQDVWARALRKSSGGVGE